ncbi:MAG: 50S ribosomal protein L25 [Actinobacteria bacterium]|nr:50S ribosomal protein L25 [Actinomycetota bacterium]
MAGERIKLDVTTREGLGSAEARRLRADGFVPGVIYGNGGEAHSFAVAERELRRALTGDHGMHAILDVVLGDGDRKIRHAVLKDYQVHPTRGRLTHVDLHEVRLDRPIQAAVVVELVGESVGVKEGGVLTQVGREVNVEALPMEIPERIELDISGLAIGDSARVSDLEAPEGVTLLDDPENVIAAVGQPRVEEEPETVPEGEEGAEGEELPDGEQPEEGAEGAGEPGADAAGDQGTTEG